ncbi:type II toxin-antitoxin system HicB family antitoxin [Moorella naiadis]|uniref:type II toxin-antitoxin system HicB family antitoxin n=1 Tax=Moorella naiadis (nom. illeg.) TaxID=3093670 RepID=UPI003D9C9EA0
MVKRRFTVIIEKDEDGKYIAIVPALPGCHTQADNLNDLDTRIQEAIKLCLGVQGAKETVPETFVGVHEIEVAL